MGFCSNRFTNWNSGRCSNRNNSMTDTQTASGTIEVMKKDNKGFKLDNGVWYSSFDPVEHKKGQRVKVTYTTNGDFKNITQTEMLEAPSIMPATSIGDNTKIRSMALSYAKDLCVAGKIGTGDIQEYYEKFVLLIS